MDAVVLDVDPNKAIVDVSLRAALVAAMRAAAAGPAAAATPGKKGKKAAAAAAAGLSVAPTDGPAVVELVKEDYLVVVVNNAFVAVARSFFNSFIIFLYL